MNLRPAKEEVVQAIARRLEKAKPPAQLVLDSVKRLSIPGSLRELTLFVCVVNPPTPGSDAIKRMFVAEYHEPDFPLLYHAKQLPPNDNAKEVTRVMLEAILAVTQQLASDPRFKRNVLIVNDVALIRSLNPPSRNGYGGTGGKAKNL